MMTPISSSIKSIRFRDYCALGVVAAAIAAWYAVSSSSSAVTTLIATITASFVITLVFAQMRGCKFTASGVTLKTTLVTSLFYPVALCARFETRGLVIGLPGILTLSWLISRKAEDVELEVQESEPDVIQPRITPVVSTRQEVSLIDTLTGAANRRYMLMFLTQEISRSMRSGQSLSLLLIDVDGLDDTNHILGRENGDEVLRSVAENLKALVRDYDVVARHSGDEFVVILPETASETAYDIAQRIHKTLLNTIRGHSTSIGVATFPNHGATAEDLLSSAHHALNRAKFSGKNQVCSCHRLAKAA